MNEIFIRTHNGFYRSGETVYGVIYLKIATPTAAFGVRLRVVGIEKYDVFLKRFDADRFANVQKRKWIDCDNIHVYRSEGGNPMAIDCYMFPFQVNLPPNLPGSCSYESNNGLDKASIKYLVEAEGLGCKNFKANQTFNVMHCPLEKPPKKPSETVKFTGGSFFRRITISVTAKLNKPEYAINETIPLLLEFTDIVKSGKEIEVISVQILQNLKCALKWKRSDSFIGSSQSVSVEAGSGDSPMAKQSHTQFKQLPSEESGTPLSQPDKCILSRELTFADNEILESGFTFFIPLAQASESVIPTTHGQYIQCSHNLKVDISITGMGKKSLVLPLRCLYPKDNVEWSSWGPPEWLYRSKLIKSPHVCSVPESILASEAFAGFPGFQAF